jgi:hypothetical protein
MKTAASSTKKESQDLAKAKKFIEVTARYISHWTEQETHKISVTNNMPYIWPIEGVGFIIGHYRVLNNQGVWQVRDSDNVLIHNFTEKLSAVFYVLCELTKRYKLSQNLLLSDTNVNRLRNDIVHYEASIKRAKKIKKYDNLDIWKARLYDANLQLHSANRELRKSVNSAKYIKYWE